MSTSPPAHPDMFSPKFGERPPVVTQRETNDPYTNADVTDLDEYRNRDVDRARRIHPSNAKEGA